MAPARLIDLTRMASRLGTGAATGIDRVEQAWTRHLLTLDDPVFALVRMKLGFALLDRRGVSALLDRASGRVAPGPADLAGRLIWREAPLRARAEADLRRLSLARVAVPGLGRLLRRLPAGFIYLNLGHANLTPRVFAAVKALGGRAGVLVHDTIPLDHPEFARAGIPAVFRRKMRAVADGADLVIHSAKATRAATDTALARLGRVPPGIVAPLGLDLAAPDPGQLPPGLPPARPFALVLGTIEPRKNLALLADVWANHRPALDLIIAGHRGWAESALFERLAATPGIVLSGALPDRAVAALMGSAEALLFPSLAEGYGLPPLEALARGLPVICADLAVLHETLGDLAVYLDPRDVYSWAKEIRALATPGARHRGGAKGTDATGFVPPSWEAHFKTVLSAGL